MSLFLSKQIFIYKSLLENTGKKPFQKYYKTD